METLNVLIQALAWLFAFLLIGASLVCNFIGLFLFIVASRSRKLAFGRRRQWLFQIYAFIPNRYASGTGHSKAC